MSEVRTTPESGVEVETETLPGSRVSLMIEVPASQVDEAFERTLRRLAPRVRVQGFRPGKAPRPLVEARIGAEALREEVADLLVPQVLSDALTEREIEPIDRPQVDIERLERGEPGRLRARVSVMPQVTLPDVAELHREPTHSEITDADVARAVEQRLDDKTEIEPVERPARDGDQVVGDLTASVDGHEVPAEARTAIELDLREGVLVPELRAALEGASAGDEVTAELTMPEDHQNPELRGKLTTLKVVVQGVKEKRVPELTDELAAELSEGRQTTADAYRDEVRRELLDTAVRSDRVTNEQRAVEAYVEAATVEVPDALIDHEIEHQMERMAEQLQQSGLKLDRYFEYLGRTEQSYRAELRPQAEGRVRTDLVLTEAARQLISEPTEEEVKNYIRQESRTEAGIAEDLDQFLSEPRSLDFFRQRLTRLRIVERVTELVTGETPQALPAEAEDEDVERIEVQIPDPDVEAQEPASEEPAGQEPAEQEREETGGAADA